MDIVQERVENTPLIRTDYSEILSELDLYKSKALRLEKMNDLYRKLAGITDMPTMIESYSIWLAEHVPHEIIGYHNLSRQRMHMFCSCHGPHRRKVISIAQKLLQQENTVIDQHRVIDGFHSHKWSFKTPENAGILILLRRDQQIPREEIDLINDSLIILAEPLAKTHNYEEIFKQARMDALTGLPNRLVFEERIDSMIEQTRRKNAPLTLAALDLDHFKAVNDTMGHLYGDEVLKQVASVLKKQIRLPDLLVRMGGDELLLVLPDTDLENARLLADRLCKAVTDLDIHAGQETLGISIGLSMWQRGMKKKHWLEQADDALYQAKKSGRNQVVG